MIALRLRHADDLSHEPRVEEEALPAGDWIRADERVLGGDGLAANSAAEFAGSLGLQVRCVNGGERFKVLLHVG